MNRSAFDVEAALRDDGWIRGLARGLLRDENEADDALQEARLTLLRSPPPRLEDPRPWLGRVALNFLRKRRREDVRRQRREHRAARPEPQHASPEEAIERVEIRRHVLEAVLALEEPYRSTVVRRYFEEMSVREIAGTAGIPVSTVKTRLARALAMLHGRLEARLGGKAWAILLVPFLAPGLRAGALGGASSSTRAAAGKASSWSGSGSLCIQGGVVAMSSKGIAIAIGVSGLLVLGGLALVQRSQERGPASSGDRPGAAGPGGTSPAESGPLPGIAEAPGRGESPDGAERISIAGRQPGGEEQASRAVEVMKDAEAADPALPASPEVLALREAYRDLESMFGDGGRTGWRAVGLEIPRLQELILAGPEGLDELLALLDEEADADFLEAVLHHLPMAKSEHRQGILDHEELRQEIWARFDQAEDPERRAAFLRFFAYERSLSASHMRDFLALAGGETDARVRQVAVDAIASHRELLADTWEVLARTFQQDTSSECREQAVQGLAHVDSDGARALVRAAFTSPDERLRAAAVSSAAGDRIPEELTGGDAAAYLISELRAARTPQYKNAILKRIVGDPREIYEEAIRRELAGEEDMGIQQSYRQALEAMEEALSARPR